MIKFYLQIGQGFVSLEHSINPLDICTRKLPNLFTMLIKVGSKYDIFDYLVKSKMTTKLNYFQSDRRREFY